MLHLKKVITFRMLNKIDYIKSLIDEGKETIALSELITLRKSVKKDSFEYGEVMNLLGSLYYRYAEFTIAISFLKSSIRVFKQHNKKEKLLRAQLNLAFIYFRIEEYNKTLDIANQLLDNQNIKPQLKWGALLKKADVFHIQNKPKEVSSIHKQLLSEVPSDHPFYIQVLNNAAINLNISEQKEKAKEYFTKAIQMSANMKQSRLLLLVNINYAEFLTENNQVDTALDILHKCLEITKENNIRISIKNISLNLAQIYEHKNQIEEASKHLKLAEIIDLELENERIKFQKYLGIKPK